MLFLDSITRKDGDRGSGAYPLGIPALRAVERLEFRARITLFSGENGSGKSTLLEGLAAGMRAYSIGHHGQVADDPYLPHAKTVAAAFLMARKTYPRTRMFMRAEDVLGYVRRINEDRLDEYRHEAARARRRGHAVAEETPDVLNRIIRSNEIDIRSHGEGFLDVLHERLHGGGLYFLDEPESPLSVLRQLELAELVRTAAREGAQFFIATHSPVLLAIPEAAILHFSDDGIVETSFDELDTIAFLRRFLNDPARYMDD